MNILTICTLIIIISGQWLSRWFGVQVGKYHVKKCLMERSSLWMKDRPIMSKEAVNILISYHEFVVGGTIEEKKTMTYNDLTKSKTEEKKWWRFQPAGKQH